MSRRPRPRRPATVGLLLAAASCSAPSKDHVAVEGPVARLEASGPVLCADPSLREAAPFTRETVETPPNSQIWVWAGGVIAADLDDDGHIDLISPSETTTRIEWGAPGGSVGEGWLEAHVEGGIDLSMGIGGTAVDFDGDGDLDLYVTRYERPNVLLENLGDRRFRDVTEAAGVPCLVPDDEGGMRGGMSLSSAWADFDRDGDLDLFVGNYGWVDHSVGSAALFGPSEPSCLYVNDGDGTFTDATAQMLPYDTFHGLHDGYVYVAGWHDLDDDGWPELYAVNDFGTAFPNVLVGNDEGRLFLDDNARGLDLAMTGMGLGVGDLNGDGLPELLVPIWNNVRLMESLTLTAGPIWTDVQGAHGVQVDRSRKQKVGWGAELEDVDNDGLLDAVVAYGHLDDLGNPVWHNPYRQPDGLYLGQPDGTFVDEGERWGVADDGVGRGFAVVDLNGDGWLDIVKRDLYGPNVTYVSRCGDAAWLRIALRAPGLNSRAIGARITVTTGDRSQVRWVRAGGTGHATGLPPEVHVGLGDADVVDRVEVRWPDGATSVFEGLEPRQILTIHRLE